MAFLQTNGTKFTLNGSPYYLFGCTIYDDLFTTHQSNIAPKFAACIAAGYNTVRFTNFMPTGVAANSEYDSTIYTYIDYVLDQARIFGLKIIFETSDLNTQAAARGYAIGDANCQAMWNNYFSWLGSRVNTVNGRTYSQDDTIGMFSLSGELTDQPLGNRVIFTSMSGYVKTYFPNTLVCPGGQKPEQILSASYGYNNYPPEDILTVATVDVCATEPYYDPVAMLLLFPNLQTYSKANNKPWFCIEFGYNQSVYPENSDVKRARDMQFVFQQGLKNGSAGFIFWNFDYGVGAGFGINPNTPQTYNMCRIFAKTPAYCPRLLVI